MKILMLAGAAAAVLGSGVANAQNLTPGSAYSNYWAAQRNADAKGNGPAYRADAVRKTPADTVGCGRDAYQAAPVAGQ